MKVDILWLAVQKNSILATATKKETLRSHFHCLGHQCHAILDILYFRGRNILITALGHENRKSLVWHVIDGRGEAEAGEHAI